MMWNCRCSTNWIGRPLRLRRHTLSQARTQPREPLSFCCPFLRTSVEQVIGIGERPNNRSHLISSFLRSPVLLTPFPTKMNRKQIVVTMEAVNQSGTWYLRFGLHFASSTICIAHKSISFISIAILSSTNKISHQNVSLCSYNTNHMQWISNFHVLHKLSLWLSTSLVISDPLMSFHSLYFSLFVPGSHLSWWKYQKTLLLFRSLQIVRSPWFLWMMLPNYSSNSTQRIILPGGHNLIPFLFVIIFLDIMSINFGSASLHILDTSR